MLTSLRTNNSQTQEVHTATIYMTGLVYVAIYSLNFQGFVCFAKMSVVVQGGRRYDQFCFNYIFFSDWGLHPCVPVKYLEKLSWSLSVLQSTTDISPCDINRTCIIRHQLPSEREMEFVYICVCICMCT